MLAHSISHYEIIEKVGEGGMGVVYKARDQALGRLVALKFLHPSLLHSDHQTLRLEREARSISALNHANIATIYELGEHEGQKFLALEYLAGGTLRDVLSHLRARGELLSLGMVLDYACGIARGLAHAHKNGIIHRDLKSSNVMFGSEGELKITDFSLAKDASATLELTEDGRVVGTPVSMSPEQAQGQEVDARSDIFSFGVVLFEMLAGRYPFEGNTAAAIVHEIIYTQAPLISRVRPDVPPALEAIVSKSLEKDRAGRYQSAGELLLDLEALRGNTPASGSSPWIGSAPVPDVNRTVTLFDSPRIRRLALLRRWGVILAIPLIAALLLIPSFRNKTNGWFGGGIAHGERSLAVTMFRNVPGDSDTQAISDGLMEVLSSKLTQLQVLGDPVLVVPASDVRRMKVTSAAQAWKELGANLAVTGSVVRTGDALTVTLNLVDTQRLVQLRTETISTHLPDAPELQEGVVAAATNMLEIALLPETREALQAGNTRVSAAYRAFLEGRGYMSSDTLPSLDSAIAAFQKAFALDSNYALALAGMAEAHLRRYSLTKAPGDIESAREEGSRALALNDKLAPIHVTVGQVNIATGAYEQAEKEFRKALELEPKSVEAYRELAKAYESMGRLALAEETYRRAVALQPQDWLSHRSLGIYYFNNGAYAKAEPEFLKVIELTPASARAYGNLGALYLKLGRSAEAVAYFKKSLELHPTAAAYSNLGTAYYLQEQYALASAQYEQAVRMTPTDSLYWGNLADSYRWTSKNSSKAAETYVHAIQLIRKELAVDARNPRLRARLASYEIAVGERSSALADAEQSLSEAPKDGYVLFHAGLVFEQAGMRERALEALQKAHTANYSLEEIQKAPPLAKLRQDPRYRSWAGAV